MKFKLQAFDILEFGQRKDSRGNAHQEDSLFPDHGQLTPNDRLFLVCDGMGGHDAGEVASATVCDTMSRYILNHDPNPEGEFSDQTLVEAVEEAFCALNRVDTGAVRKMGTTMTLLKLHSNGCTIAHIGDSRVYQIRPGQTQADTKIVFVTEDHSLVNELVKYGEITKEQARNHPKKNVITRAMQPNMERYPKVDVYHSCDIQPGDYFYLCTDGMLEIMEDYQLCYYFSNQAGDDLTKIAKLIEATKDNRDNHTAIMVHILDVEGQPVAPDEDDQKVKSLPVNPQCRDMREDITDFTSQNSNHLEDEDITSFAIPSAPMHASSKNMDTLEVGEVTLEEDTASAALDNADEQTPTPPPFNPSAYGSSYPYPQAQGKSASQVNRPHLQSQDDMPTSAAAQQFKPDDSFLPASSSAKTGEKAVKGSSSKVGKSGILAIIGGIVVLLAICYFLMQQCTNGNKTDQSQAPNTEQPAGQPGATPQNNDNKRGTWKGNQNAGKTNSSEKPSDATSTTAPANQDQAPVSEAGSDQGGKPNAELPVDATAQEQTQETQEAGTTTESNSGQPASTTSTPSKNPADKFNRDELRNKINGATNQGTPSTSNGTPSTGTPSTGTTTTTETPAATPPSSAKK